MEGNTIGAPSVALLGLDGFVVLSAVEVAGEVEVLVETTESVTGCPRCGVVAEPHGRRPVTVRDLPIAGRPSVLVWAKRLWRCQEPLCGQRTWSETHPAIRSRAVLTERARAWAMRRVGAHAETVASVARQLGVGWHTVMRAVREHGEPLVDDPARLEPVTALGVDEHVWAHVGPRRRRTGFATGIVDLTPGRPPRLLDVVEGRTGTVYADWLTERGDDWRERIRVAALDPFRGYATALATALPDAVRVLDAFHVVKLGNDVVDQVRRRVQQETLGHRGYKDDPLYRLRRLLRRGAETLSTKARARLDAALQAGDPGPGGHRRLGLRPTAPRGLPRTDTGRGTPARDPAARQPGRLPDPRSRPARPHPPRLADGVSRLLRHRRRIEWTDRGHQPAHREAPPRRPRLPQLQQLPAAPPARLRTQLAD